MVGARFVGSWGFNPLRCLSTPPSFRWPSPQKSSKLAKNTLLTPSGFTTHRILVMVEPVIFVSHSNLNPYLNLTVQNEDQNHSRQDNLYVVNRSRITNLIACYWMHLVKYSKRTIGLLNSILFQCMFYTNFLPMKLCYYKKRFVFFVQTFQTCLFNCEQIIWNFW